MIVGSPDYIRPMRWSCLLLVLALACGSGDDPCVRFFKPYPNLIGERPRTAANAALMDAMAAYDRNDFATAAVGLAAVIDKDADDRLARLYLANALLGSGEPYKAEMHVDFLERVAGTPFHDQTDWLNTLCWLCSGQQARALAEAQRISARPAHTYKSEAAALVEALTEK